MRFRLLSYLAAMLLLAGVVGTNVTPRVASGNAGYTGCRWDGKAVTFSGQDHIAYYGWPFAALEFVKASEKFELFHRKTAHKRVQLPPQSLLVWHYPALAFDIAIGLAIPIAGMFACEFMLRKHAPRRKVE